MQMDIFQVAASDYSLQMLYYIFSPLMDSIVKDIPTADSLLADAFSAGFNVFNAAVLFLGAVYVIIHSASAVLRTAHEGEVMGKSWSSMWVPLRLSIGFAVLLPLSSGYSLVQGGVMWFTISGVGLANTVSSIMVSKMDPRNNLHLVMRSQDIYPIARDIFIATSCNADLQRAVNSESALRKTASKEELKKVKFAASYSPNYTGMELLNGRRVPTGFYYDFGDLSDVFGKQACGRIEVSTAEMTKVVGKLTQSSTDGSSGASDSVNSMPEHAALQSKASNDFNVKFQKEFKLLVDNIEELVVGLGVEKGGDGAIDPESETARVALYKYSQEFNANMVAYLKAQSQEAKTQKVWDVFIADQLKIGWVGLGGVYYRLAKLNDDYARLSNTDTSVDSATVSPKDQKVGFWGSLWSDKSDHLNDAKENSLELSAKRISDWTSYMQAHPDKMAELSKSVDTESIISQGNDKSPKDADGIINTVANKIAGGVDFAELTKTGGSSEGSFIAGSRSPIIQAKIYGDRIIWTATAGILGVAAINGTVDGAARVANTIGAIPGFGQVTAFATGMMKGSAGVLVPIFIILTVSLLFFGAVLAFYIPMVPFITWVGGVVSWLTAVVEAMIIAPIWAISFLSPEGEGFAGQRAEQGFLLILSIFLRPVLMVFGFFAALAVSYVVFAFINSVYWDVFNSTQTGFSLLLAYLAKMAIYSVIALSTMATIYQLIHVIPDKVLRWIGGGQEALGDMGAEQQSRAAFAAVISSTSGATSSSVAQIAGKEKKEGKAKKEGLDDGNGGGGNTNSSTAEKDGTTTGDGASTTTAGGDATESQGKKPGKKEENGAS